MDKPLVEFNPKISSLNVNQIKVLKLLVEAAKLIIPIYVLQENKKYPGANFYPHGITKSEIEKAAQDNPEILSPYTIVEKINGKLVSISYHEKYSKLLKPISEKLMQAAKTTDNKDFAKALQLQAKALTSGSYKEATTFWLKIKPYILDISIGPVDRLDDQLFFAKASYQAWVGVLDIEGTNRLNNYKSIALSASRKALLQSDKIDNRDKVKAKVIDVILLSGLIARRKFVGVSFPLDLDIVEEYGTEVTLFNQTNDLRLKEQIIPTFDKIFSKSFREGFSFEDLRRGYLRAVALHQLAHSYLHYKNAARNLQGLFPVIDELAATILGLRIAGPLLLKDRITNKQLESMIVAYICRSFYHLRQSSQDKSVNNYTLGAAIFINFIFENGAIKQSGAMIVPNFIKIFVSLNELSDMLERLLALGSHEDAQSFIKKYTKSKNFNFDS